MSWKNKQVLVTGADGFIGSHLVEALVEQGARVRAFVYYNSFNTWGWLDTFDPKILKKVEVFAGDIRDPNGVAEAVQGCEMVFHLAALIGIPFSYHSPDSYIDTNVKGTLNVLQASRRFNVGKVVHTSTSEVYGTAQTVPIGEEHPINPQSPYAASKAGGDHLAQSFYLSFGLPVTTLRPFNTFGPRQSARAIIPTIIAQIYAGVQTLKLGNLDVTRDLNYVSNTVNAFLQAAVSPETAGQVYNAGSGMEISIKNLVVLIQEITGTNLEVVVDQERLRPAKSEVERLVCNADKLTALGAYHQVSLKEGLAQTCQWIKDNGHHYKADIYNV